MADIIIVIPDFNNRCFEKFYYLFWKKEIIIQCRLIKIEPFDSAQGSVYTIRRLSEVETWSKYYKKRN